MIQLVVALVLSWIDYCNTLLAGLPWTAIKPLQHAQNAAACLVCEFAPLYFIHLLTGKYFTSTAGGTTKFAGFIETVGKRCVRVSSQLVIRNDWMW